MRLPKDDLLSFFYELIQCVDFPDHAYDLKIKLVFFRSGEGSYVPEPNVFPGILAMVEKLDFPVISRISGLAVSETVKIFPADWGWMKSTSALPYVLASMERTEKQCDELLLCSPEGFVVEGTFTSIFWQMKGRLHFTSAGLGGIESCMRKFMQQHLHEKGLSYSETEIRAEDLLANADWICCLSGLGIRVWFSSPAKRDVPEVLRHLPLMGFLHRPF